VIFGKTNVPFAMADWQTFNAIHGTTNNPWNTSRVSSGSAAVLSHHPATTEPAPTAA